MEPWQRLNSASAADARDLLLSCCGSAEWARRMEARRPFSGERALLDAARAEWLALAPGDWREAFSHHPKIGDREALRARFPSTHRMSEREQSGVEGAAEDVLSELASLNAQYEQKFGYIFIVCATGLSAEVMLEHLRGRIGNDPAAELDNAVREQARITELRLLCLGG